MSKCIKCGSYAFNLYKEGIDQGGFCDVHYWQGRAHRAEALAEQPAHAPVEWMEMVVANLVREGVNKHKARELADHFIGLATAPAWVSLTDEEIESLDCVYLNWMDYEQVEIKGDKEFARAIEAKLKEKNR